jgi:hypothetical protein
MAERRRRLRQRPALSIETKETTEGSRRNPSAVQAAQSDATHTAQSPAVQAPSSPQPTERELADRGAAPFAPDFVADAADVARGSIGLPSGGRFVAAIALTSLLGAVTMLAAGPLPSPAATPSAVPQGLPIETGERGGACVPETNGTRSALRRSLRATARR